MQVNKYELQKSETEELNEYSQQNGQGSEDNQPQTSDFNKKKKKKRLIRRVKKHSPEYYEQLKIAKVNQVRQIRWDSRFILNSIPQLKKEKRKSNNKFRDRSPMLDSLNKDSVKPHKNMFPSLDTQNQKTTSKSFQVRISKRNQINKAEIGKILQNKLNTQSKPLNAEQIINSKLHRELQKIYQQYKFPLCHRQWLIQIIDNGKLLNYKKFIQNQLKQIELGKALICECLKSIQQRQKQVSKLREVCSNKVNIIQKNVVRNYRLSTLKCIEQILKWKEQIQSVYKGDKRITYIYQGSNYLTTIGKDLAFLQKQQFWKCKSKDPFLISLYEEEDKPTLLKIRASELLLLEQQIQP